MANKTLPDGWDRKTLGEISDLMGGGTPSREHSEYFGGDIVWLTPTEIPKTKISVISNSRERITNDGLRKSSARLIPPGAVLMTSRASIGYVAIAGTEVTTNQGFASFIPKEGINNFYLAYWLWANADFFIGQATGTTFKEITKSKLRNFSLPVPPLPEQERIVGRIEELFSDLEAGMAALERVREGLKRYKASVLKAAVEGKLLENRGIEKSEELPEGWRWVVVREIGEAVTGTTPSKANPDYYNDDFPFYKPTDLDSGFYTKESRDGLSILGIEKARLLPAMSVLVTCIGATIGKTGLIRVAGASNQQINAIIPNEKIISEYLYYVCISPQFQKSIKDNASATTLPILNKSKFEELPIPLPPLGEQQRIVTEVERRLSVVGEVESAVEVGLARAARLRQSVLKSAFEGRL